MSEPSVTRMGRLKGIMLSRFKLGLYTLAYAGLMPRRWSARLIATYWEDSAEDIHGQGSSGTGDFELLSSIIKRYRPKTILDAGCGSGRLFQVYHQCGVVQVTGVDVSARALEIAKRAYPKANVYQARLEDLEYPPDAFDLGVCNRVLQHVPAKDIQVVVQKLGRACRMLYINELTQSDHLEELYYMKRYDYLQLFGQCGLVCLETRQICGQPYFVFGRLPNAAAQGAKV